MMLLPSHIESTFLAFSARMRLFQGFLGLDDGGSGVRRDEIALIVARIVRDLVLNSIEKETIAGHKIKPRYPSALRITRASCQRTNGSFGDVA